MVLQQSLGDAGGSQTRYTTYYLKLLQPENLRNLSVSEAQTAIPLKDPCAFDTLSEIDQMRRHCTTRKKAQLPATEGEDDTVLMDRYQRAHWSLSIFYHEHPPTC